MELLPVIYNSLLIAAGLFVVTIAISFVSYKIKQNKGGTTTKTNEYDGVVFKNKKRIEEELKPHYKTKHPKSPPQKREVKEVERKEPQKRKPKPEPPRKPSPEKKHEPKKPERKLENNRIERVKDLVPPELDVEERKSSTMEKRKLDNEEKRNKKKLKSIDDDPLKKYTDSADDDLHPLKTDD